MASFLHNDKPSKHGLIICIDIDWDTKIDCKVEAEITKWVYDSLENARESLGAGVGILY
jgi:hypothetical protein